MLRSDVLPGTALPERGSEYRRAVAVYRAMLMDLWPEWQGNPLLALRALGRDEPLLGTAYDAAVAALLGRTE